jgi:putative aldouronate transport system permease protein
MVNKMNRPLTGHKKKNFWKKYFGSNAGDIIFNILNYLFFAALFLVCLYPFYYVVKTSLIVQDASSGSVVTKLSFESYAIVFSNNGLVQSFFLSVGVTLVYSVLSVLITVISAYPLTKRNLKGKKFIVVFLLISMLFSGGLIPYYLMIKQLGLFNNILVYLFVGLVNPFYVIIVKNFISSIPNEIFESARIDGASETRVVFQIVIPLSGPIIATIALWAGVDKWNDWMTGVLYMQNSKDLWMIQQFLRNILITTSAGQGVVDPDIMAMADSVKMAAIVISILPIILIYPFAQKYFVKGVLLGSVKG